MYKDICGSPIESVHLKHLKWILGIHKKSSNIASWGDLGRITIVDSCVKLTLSYFKRLEELEEDSFVKAAFNEQKRLNLQWYDNITKIRSSLTDSPRSNRPLEGLFTKMWSNQVTIQTKLDLYRQLKSVFTSSPDKYLSNITSHLYRTTVTKLRISAHQLGIETGRYTNTPREKRLCPLCDDNRLDNEDHLLSECNLPSLSNARKKISTMTGPEPLSATVFLGLFSTISYSNSDNEHLLVGLNKLAKHTHQLYNAKLEATKEYKKRTQTG